MSDVTIQSLKARVLAELGFEPKSYAEALCAYIEHKVDGVTPDGFGFEGVKTVAFAKACRKCGSLSEDERRSADNLVREVNRRLELRKSTVDCSDILARLKREAGEREAQMRLLGAASQSAKKRTRKPKASTEKSVKAPSRRPKKVEARATP